MEEILTSINQASLKFLVPLTIEDTYAKIVQEAVKLVRGDDGLIVREENGKFITVYGSSPQAVLYHVRPRGNTFTAYTKHKAIIMHADDIQKTNPAERSIKSVIFIPLSYKDKSEGVLLIRSTKDKHFTEKETKILQLFGSFASLAIKKNELYEETKRALEIRDQFISLASHELRTPLTSISGYIQLLHTRMKDKDTSEAKWVKELYGESKRMTNLVQELLEINRIKQGQLQFNLREVFLSSIVQEAIALCTQAYGERNIILNNKISDKEDIIVGDYDKLLKVVTALLGNAMKFSPPQSAIQINISAKNNMIVLQIVDQGSGIAREDINHIFDGFYKAKDNNTQGLGVGLLLAKHIIQNHHGSISVNSTLKQGTTMEVLLPRHTL